MRRKIGYDARMIEHSGIGVRIQHILNYWPLGENEAELFVFGDEKVLKDHRLPPHAKIINYTASIYSLKEWIGHAKMKEMDYLDIPHFNVPLLYIKKCIITIHDLIPYHFKSAHSSLLKRIYLNFVLRMIAYFALKIITVSNYTKDDFTNHFQTKGKIISVIYNGIDPSVFNEKHLGNLEEFREKMKLPNDFLLTIGIGKAHKNFKFLIENLTKLWNEKRLQIPLVIGGLGREIPTEIENFKREFPEKIFYLPHLPYVDLPKVYKIATIFLFPSLFEGFGFPVLEAQAVGTPVLSSDATVLPEILENSALLFNGRNNEDFQEKLVKLLSDSEQLSKLSKLGLQNSQRFHWNEQMEDLRAFYLPLLA